MGKQYEDDYNKLDDEIIDIDEVVGTDVKINPDYYIHNAILKAQNALNKEDVKIGFLQFRMLVEHIEVLCTAAKMIPSGYDDDLKTFRDSDDYKGDDKSVLEVRLANKKLELLMMGVFANKTITEPLKS